MRRNRATFNINWPIWGLVAAALCISLTALLLQLRPISAHLSSGEIAQLSNTRYIRVILHEPLNLPYKCLLYLVQLLPLHTPFIDRLPSVLLGLSSLVLFTYLLHRWYGLRSAVFGFCILVCSAWFLHISRLIGYDIEYLWAILSLLAAHVALYDYEDYPVMGYCWIIVSLSLLFIPGLEWFVILSALWQLSTIVRAWQALQPTYHRAVIVLLTLMTCGSLVYTFIRSPVLLSSWLGIPLRTPEWRLVLTQIGHGLEPFVFHVNLPPSLWLGQLPLIDGFIAITFLAGTFFYLRHWRAIRSQLLALYLVVGTLLIGLDNYRLSIILPVIYLIAIAGIAYLLHEWLRVFPQNQLARSVGIGILVITLSLSCFYNLSQYFIAWPRSQQIIMAFQDTITTSVSRPAK